MSDVSGPVSTLPGATWGVAEGVMCDDHPDVPAVRRVQGETDYFGAEYYDLCAECLAEIRKHNAESRSGICDWCRNEAKDLRPHRDCEEGRAGRVYDVCGACVKREVAALKEEYDRNWRESER